MPKKFYTDKDIEELHHSGVKSLEIGDDVVLTDLAYEKAKRLGFQLITEGADKPPAAPVRPYLSARKSPQADPRASLTTSPTVDSVASAALPQPALEKRIRDAVIARLGNQVDAKLLDTIIKRTLKVTGMK
jgi:hypothetical protein